MENNPLGKNADAIVATKAIDHSSWHFHQAVSWLDFLKRERNPASIHYCAIHLRYGIEYLLFELIILVKKELIEEDYKKCLGKPDRMKKMLLSADPSYTKLRNFTEIIFELDKSTPKVTFWDLNDLFMRWGIASEFLHFFGIYRNTYNSEEWISSTINRLEVTIAPIWENITQNIGVGLFKVDTMPKLVREVWSDYHDKKIDEEAVKFRLKIIQPMLKNKGKINL